MSRYPDNPFAIPEKNPDPSTSVIPAKAGIHAYRDVGGRAVSGTGGRGRRYRGVNEWQVLPDGAFGCRSCGWHFRFAEITARLYPNCLDRRLQQAAFGQGDRFFIADHDVIQHPDIDQPQHLF